MTGYVPRIPLRLLAVITGPALAEKAQAVFNRERVPFSLRVYASGTATSEVMDLLGLGSSGKTVMLSLVSRGFADSLMDSLREELFLGSPNTGIAFTVPLTGSGLALLRAVASREPYTAVQEEQHAMTDMLYSLVVTVLDRGYTDEVMQAARSAGAYGGTVLHARALQDTEIVQNFHLSLNDEKEIVLILTEKEKKLSIMQAISDRCGLNSEAKGLVVSLPIDHLIGLKRPYRVQKMADEGQTLDTDAASAPEQPQKGMPDDGDAAPAGESK